MVRITKCDRKKKLLSAPLKTVPDSETKLSLSVVISYDHLQASHNDVFTTQYNLNIGWRIQCQQFRACLIKKWLYLCRSWAIIFIQGFPVVLTLMVYTAFTTSSTSEINLKLSLDKYGDTITPVLCRNRSDGLCDAYERYANPITSVIQAKMAKADFDMHEYILAESKKSLSIVNSRFIIALEQVVYIHRNMTQVLYVAHYNNQPYHGQPVTLNFLMNAVLRVLTGNDKKEIVIYNHPLPISAYDRTLSRKSTEIVIFVLGMILILSISFVVSSFGIFLIQERAGKAKHLQCVSGLGVTTYWLSNFAFDSISYLITVALLMAVIVTFALDPFSENKVFAGIFLLLTAFGWAAIPIVYISSFFFNLPATGFTTLAVISIFTGIGPCCIMVVIQIPGLEAYKLAETLESIFLFFPSFAMGYGIIELGSNRNLHLECPALFVAVPQKLYCAFNHANSDAPHPCCTLDVEYFAWHSYGIGKNLALLFATGLVAVIVLILIEAKLFKKLQDLRQSVRHNVDKANDSTTKKQAEDEDVISERNRVGTNGKQLLKSENLVIRNLTKYFGAFKAVDSLSLGIEKGECFGLLGVNGAGKTTTFRILTGDLLPSSGEAFIVGRSIKTKKSNYQQVGYCPQFDALINKLTGREMIRLFARFRGIHENEINNVADRLGVALTFSEFLDIPVFAYSGGNQRKLSTAIALVGNPPLVFLDEPSSGMDPVARRHLWDCLSKVQESGASLVLTSHSMEECEALCTRLTIMVLGRFRCLGSIQHLKSKFSEGFTVTAQIQHKTPTIKENDQVLKQRKSSTPGHISFEWETDLKPLQQFIEASFPDSVLKDVHAGYVHYQVRNPSLSWGFLFQKMEEAKILFGLEDYSVGQTSMDQIFLMFGEKQDSDE